jgi:pentatricopeptide repeat protein
VLKSRGGITTTYGADLHVVYCVLLSCAGVHACVCVGKFRQAEALLEPLKAAAGAAGRPMVSAHNLMLKGHVAADNLDAARRTFSAMTSRGLTPDAVTFNTLISGFVNRGDMAQAQSVLRSMRVEGVQPDAWTFTTLALGYGRQGQMQEMRDVVQQMQQAGVKANSVSWAGPCPVCITCLYSCFCCCFCLSSCPCLPKLCSSLPAGSPEHALCTC